MASNILNKKNRVKELVQSFRVNAPLDRSDFSFLLNPRRPCGQMRDCSSSALMIQNYSNFKKSSSPARIMFYHDGSWVDFQGQVIDTIRSAFLHRNPVIELQIDGSEYLFDFLRMVQIDVETENQRSIAWIDEDGKCFFPKEFVDYEEVLNSKDNSTNPKIEVEIRIDAITGKRRREVSEQKEEEEVNSTNEYRQELVLKKLRVTTADLETFQWASCKVLEEGDRNYASISSLFLSTFRKRDPWVTITAVHQCTRSGPLERARFDTFQKQIELTRATRGTSNMVYAWYVTSRKSVGHILLHGFGEANKVPPSDSYGEGVYLSPVASPHTSSLLSEADENGEKHIILCRIILGNVEKVELGSQQSHPSCMDFDTGVDDTKNPKWYIVWCTNMNRHILPECVVSYKSSSSISGNHGRLKGSTDSKHVPLGLGSLLSKMKGFLPPNKYQEVGTLFETFKAGKFAKDRMVKQLRSIVGDEMLLSTIREIHGRE